MRHTLGALRAGAPSAADHVPLLMRQCAELARLGDGAPAELLSAGLRDLPALWPLLRWSAQLVGTLSDDTQAPLALPALVAIATRYPQAIYFQFQLAKPGLTAAAAARAAPLDRALRSDALEPLVRAFDDLTHPELRAKDFLNACIDALGRDDVDGARALWRAFRARVLDPRRPGLGKYNVAFAETNAAALERAFGKDGERLCARKGGGLDHKAALELRAKLERALTPGGDSGASGARARGGGGLPPNSVVGAFSSFLAQYRREPERGADGSWGASTRAADGDADGVDGAPAALSPARPVADLSGLELPGAAYDGHTDPAIRGADGVTWVDSFDSLMATMSSIRKPKAVTVRCSDQRERRLLVKGGEDLRLDQRLQQLLRVMNGALARDGPSAARALRVRTYAVLPLSLSVGLIEWLDGTSPLKAVLAQEEARAHAHAHAAAAGAGAGRPQAPREASLASGKHAAQAEYARLYPSFRAYVPAFASRSRADVSGDFARIARMLPHGLLRGALLARAPCAEAFLERRAALAKSLCALSVCGWVAGIGDRHLDNFLLDGRSGELVPIDFGHAFGTATFMLPVPELVPFRLTPQLCDVLAPHRTADILHAHMVATLAALRKARLELLRVCDVFVAEPIADWLKGDSRESGGSDGGRHVGGSADDGGDGQGADDGSGGAVRWCAPRPATRARARARSASAPSRLRSEGALQPPRVPLRFAPRARLGPCAPGVCGGADVQGRARAHARCRAQARGRTSESPDAR